MTSEPHRYHVHRPAGGADADLLDLPWLPPGVVAFPLVCRPTGRVQLGAELNLAVGQHLVTDVADIDPLAVQIDRERFVVMRPDWTHRRRGRCGSGPEGHRPPPTCHPHPAPQPRLSP